MVGAVGLGREEAEGGSYMCQLDGNMSVATYMDSEEEGEQEKEKEQEEEVEREQEEALSAPVPIPLQQGHRPAPLPRELRAPVRRTVLRSNKLVDALSMPRITLYNMRSAWSKLDNLAEDMLMRKTDLSILTEVWHMAENRKHEEAIEQMLELHGVKYVSTPRPGARRGGGTAVACSDEFFHMTKLYIAIPKPLEAYFRLVRPKNPSGRVAKILCCSFYSPPKSPHRNNLLQAGQVPGGHPGQA